MVCYRSSTARPLHDFKAAWLTSLIMVECRYFGVVLMPVVPFVALPLLVYHVISFMVDRCATVAPRRRQTFRSHRLRRRNDCTIAMSVIPDNAISFVVLTAYSSLRGMMRVVLLHYRYNMLCALEPLPPSSGLVMRFTVTILLPVAVPLRYIVRRAHLAHMLLRFLPIRQAQR